MLRPQEDAVVSGVTFPKNSVFAGVASVDTNNVMLEVNRLGPTRVAASIYDYNYMPGIMIDPFKRVAKDASLAGQDLQQQSMQEVSTAIDRSASAANSVVGVGGRVAMGVLSRPKSRTKLRDVLPPDGYPILTTTPWPARWGRPRRRDANLSIYSFYDDEKDSFSGSSGRRVAAGPGR